MEEHAYDEKNITMCQTCKKIYDKNGETDAQIEDFHYIVPLANNKRKRENNTSEDSDRNYDDHSYDVPSNRNYDDHSYDVPSNRNYDDHSYDVPSNRNYDVPGYDIRNANELGDSSRNVRLKKEFTGKYAVAPASQLDAFEFYDGGKKRRTRRRKTHKKTNKKQKKNKTKRRIRRRR